MKENFSAPICCRVCREPCADDDALKIHFISAHLRESTRIDRWLTETDMKLQSFESVAGEGMWGVQELGSSQRRHRDEVRATLDRKEDTDESYCE